MSLGDATDALNKALREAETYLEGLGLGVTACVKMERGTLWFGKLDQRWCFIFENDKNFSTELLKCSRELRLDAVKHLRDLRVALRAQAEEEEGDVWKAVGEIRDFVEGER